VRVGSVVHAVAAVGDPAEERLVGVAADLVRARLADGRSAGRLGAQALAGGPVLADLGSQGLDELLALGAVSVAAAAGAARSRSCWNCPWVRAIIGGVLAVSTAWVGSLTAGTSWRLVVSPTWSAGAVLARARAEASLAAVMGSPGRIPDSRSRSMSAAVMGAVSIWSLSGRRVSMSPPLSALGAPGTSMSASMSGSIARSASQAAHIAALAMASNSAGSMPS
jgi:hypothetical protein